MKTARFRQKQQVFVATETLQTNLQSSFDLFKLYVLKTLKMLTARPNTSACFWCEILFSFLPLVSVAYPSAKDKMHSPIQRPAAKTR